MNNVFKVALVVIAVGLAALNWHHFQQRAREDELASLPKMVTIPESQTRPGTSPVPRSKGVARPAPITGGAVVAAGRELCAGKKMCAVIYIAPWCPYCLQSMPAYRGYLANASHVDDAGIEVFVGQGRTAADNLEMVQRLGTGAYADQDNTVGRGLGVDRFPSYFVLDEHRAVVQTEGAAAQWIDSRFR